MSLISKLIESHVLTYQSASKMHAGCDCNTPRARAPLKDRFKENPQSFQNRIFNFKPQPVDLKPAVQKAHVKYFANQKASRDPKGQRKEGEKEWPPQGQQGPNRNKKQPKPRKDRYG